MLKKKQLTRFSSIAIIMFACLLLSNLGTVPTMAGAFTPNTTTDFEQVNSIGEAFNQGFMEEEKWDFIELTGSLGSEVEGKDLSSSLLGNANDDSFQWRTSSWIAQENGNSFLRIQYIDNSTTRDLIPESVAQEVGVPFDQRNESRWTMVVFEDGAFKTKVLTWTSRQFKVIFNTTFEWTAESEVLAATLHADMRMLFNDDPNGDFKTNHTQEVIKEIRITMTRKAKDLDSTSTGYNMSKPLAEPGSYRSTFHDREIQFSAFDLRLFSEPGIITFTLEVIFQENENILNTTGIVLVDLDNLELQLESSKEIITVATIGFELTVTLALALIVSKKQYRQLQKK